MPPRRPMDPALPMAPGRTQAQAQAQVEPRLEPRLEPRVSPGRAWPGLRERHLPGLPQDLPQDLRRHHWSSVPRHPVSRP